MVTKLQEDYGKLVEAVCCRRTTASWWRTTASWWTTASWLRTKASWWRADGLHQLAVFLIPPPCSPTPPPSPAAPRGCRFRSPECSRDDVAVSLHRHTVRRAEARPRRAEPRVHCALCNRRSRGKLIVVALPALISQAVLSVQHVRWISVQRESGSCAGSPMHIASRVPPA